MAKGVWVLGVCAKLNWTSLIKNDRADLLDQNRFGGQ
jgi:hypothetical protein